MFEQQSAVTAAEDGLVLSLAVEPRTIAPGDTARIDITLRNARSRSASLEAGGCPLVHYIEDAAGEVVEPEGGDWICIQILRQITLGPGDSEQRSATWTGESCRWVDGERECTALPPGEYRVYATFRASEGGRPVFLRTPDVSLRLDG